MASPPPPIQVSISPEAALAHLRASASGSALRDFAVDNPRVDGWGPPLGARLTVTVTAPVAWSPSGTRYQVELLVPIDPTTGEPLSDPETAKSVERLAGLRTIIGAVEGDSSLGLWLATAGATGRYEDRGGFAPDRIHYASARGARTAIAPEL